MSFKINSRLLLRLAYSQALALSLTWTLGSAQVRIQDRMPKAQAAEFGTIFVPVQATESMTQDVNDEGEAVGWARDAKRGFAWVLSEELGVVDLAALGGFALSSASKINNAGQVLVFGIRDDEEIPQARLFIWSADEGLNEVPKPAACLWPVGVDLNEDGAVVAECGATLGAFRKNLAFLWTPGVGIDIIPHERLGNAEPVQIFDLNDEGDVIGQSGRAGAFSWSRDDGFQTIATGPAVFPLMINESGEVVGYTVSETNLWRAFRWDDEDGIEFLDLTPRPPTSSEFLLNAAVAINDRGQLVVRSVLNTIEGENISESHLRLDPDEAATEEPGLSGFSTDLPLTTPFIVRPTKSFDNLGRLVMMRAVAPDYGFSLGAVREAVLWTPNEGLRLLAPDAFASAAFAISGDFVAGWIEQRGSLLDSHRKAVVWKIPSESQD